MSKVSAELANESLVAAQVLLADRQQLVILSSDPGHLKRVVCIMESSALIRPSAGTAPALGRGRDRKKGRKRRNKVTRNWISLSFSRCLSVECDNIYTSSL